MTLENIEYRIIKKLGILNYLNISKYIYYKNKKINIPVINSIGYPNLFLKPTWISLLIQELFIDNEGAFVDVGANIGQTLIAVKMADCSICYIGFEPSASCCYYLKILIKNNKFTNCHVYNFALSNSLHEAFLETNGEADPTGSLIQKLRPNFFNQRDSVFALDYDRLNIEQKISYVKIDVEGGELEVLMGMQKLIDQNRPYIFCEILDSFSENVLEFTQQRANKVCTLLKIENYSIVQLVQNEATDQIVSFVEIDIVQIKQWDKNSLKLNDYIFFPTERQQAITQILMKICQ